MSKQWELTPPMKSLIERLRTEEFTYWDLRGRDRHSFQIIRKRGIVYTDERSVICFSDETLNANRKPLANPLPEWTLNQNEWAYLEKMCEPEGMTVYPDAGVGVRSWARHIYSVGLATCKEINGIKTYHATAEGFDALEAHENEQEDAS